MKRCRRLVSLFLCVCFLLCSSLSLNVSAASGGSFSDIEDWELPKGYDGAVIDMYFASGAFFRFCFQNLDDFDIEPIHLSGGTGVVEPGALVLHCYRGGASYKRYWVINNKVEAVVDYKDIKAGQISGKYTPVRVVVSSPELLEYEEMFLDVGVPYTTAPMPNGSNSMLNSLKEWFAKLWEWLSSILQSIKDIPNKIYDFFTELFDWLDWLFQYAIDEVSGFFTDLKNSIQGFFIKLVDDIKSLFIPSEEFLMTYQENWKLWFKNHLGAIYEVITFTSDTISSLKDFNPSSTPSITLPAIDLPMPSGTYHLMDSQVYTFDILNSAPWSTLYGMYKSMVWVFAFMALYKLLTDTYERIVNN